MSSNTVTYSIDWIKAKQYFAHMYETNPEVFKNFTEINVYKKTIYEDHEHSAPDFLEFYPGNTSEFIIHYLDQEIKIKFISKETASSGILRDCHIFETNKNKEAVNSLFRQITSFTLHTTGNNINLYEPDSGFWNFAGSIKVQTIDHLYIPSGIISDIRERIKRFESQKDRYAKFGKPWKLNFMLCGTPGSGKTSLVKAIANAYSKSLYVLQLNSETKASDIMKNIKRINSNSILLIEDIDSYFKGRKTEDTGLSFSTFINILDGVSGKLNGLITFLTANYPETLDSAILRPGRIDYIAKFDYPKKKEIRSAFFDLVANATDADFDSFYSSVKDYKVTMSGIVDYLFLFGENPEDIKTNMKVFFNDQQVIRSGIDTDQTEKMYT